MLLADTMREEGPKDPFKTMHNMQTKKRDIVDKVNHTAYKPEQSEYEDILANHEGPGIKNPHNYRWTTVENQFTRKKKRLFDELPTA